MIFISRIQDYQRHLTSQPTDNDDFGPAPEIDKENMPLETLRGADGGTESYRQDFLGMWTSNVARVLGAVYLTKKKCCKH